MIYIIPILLLLLVILSHNLAKADQKKILEGQRVKRAKKAKRAARRTEGLYKKGESKCQG